MGLVAVLPAGEKHDDDHGFEDSDVYKRQELMCAAQGLEFRKPLKPSREVGRAHAAVRAVVPRLEQDRTLAPDIDALAAAIRSGAFNAWCQ